MSNIKVSRQHNLPMDEARSKAEALAEDLGREFNVNYEWNGNQLDFKRSGVKGDLKVKENSIDVDLHLGLLARPFKSRIEQELHKHLDHLVRG
ncbi:polyhydroxyalkanoic acid system family protein [Allohahella sp. A8]|uniref:polyhydroxyalkanoic acid system family protein n=1 Tax=Allohahella sp. A8 TaxID=3141461 RepID=UPI003A806906